MGRAQREAQAKPIAFWVKRTSAAQFNRQALFPNGLVGRPRAKEDSDTKGHSQ
jgi:hypothetical protein